MIRNTFITWQTVWPQFLDFSAGSPNKNEIYRQIERSFKRKTSSPLKLAIFVPPPAIRNDRRAPPGQCLNGIQAHNGVAGGSLARRYSSHHGVPARSDPRTCSGHGMHPGWSAPRARTTRPVAAKFNSRLGGRSVRDLSAPYPVRMPPVDRRHVRYHTLPVARSNVSRWWRAYPLPSRTRHEARRPLAMAQPVGGNLMSSRYPARYCDLRTG
jgi:hypothetical protein